MAGEDMPTRADCVPRTEGNLPNALVTDVRRRGGAGGFCVGFWVSRLGGREARVFSGRANSLSRVKCWMETPKLDAGIDGGELPPDLGRVGVAGRGPLLNSPRHGYPVGKPLSEALALQHRQLDLSDVQPTPMLRGVVNLDLVGEPFGLGRGNAWERKASECILSWSSTSTIRSASGKWTSTKSRTQWA